MKDNEWGEKVRMGNRIRALNTRLAMLVAADDGMSTVEYAIGTIAAAAFGAILYTVVTGDSIVSALTNIISRALNTNV
ncbi:membrane protein [Mycolicibacterium novocastrense]|uniref:Membrane protein n=2 Tax=Mycolicibacterium novocastrense TaxID=59813 RepID=A0ABQ0KPN4_MYCNV|nr:membrane protein [Mycolicibacterium novocastrense]